MMKIWTTYRPNKPFVVINPIFIDGGVEGQYDIELDDGSFLRSNGIWKDNTITRIEVV